jgi:ABC-type nitrate/sulfonate/bicarbonate transport system permease component
MGLVRRYALVLAVLVTWEASVRVTGASSVFLPSPSKIAAKLLGVMFLSGEIWRHFGASMARLAIGVSVATLIAVSVGVVMGCSQRVYVILESTIELLRPIPAIALIPFAIFYLGIGDASKIFLIVYGAMFPLLLNTIAGMRSVDTVLINAGRVLGAKPHQVIWRIRIPWAFPYMLTGFRISVGLGLIVLVASEMVAAVSGLGFYILNSEMTWKIEEMFSGIILLATVGVILNGLILRVESRVMRWR